MDKRKVISEIQNYLAHELSELMTRLEAPGNIKPDEVAGVTDRVEEIRHLLVMYKFLPLREYGKDDVICPGGLVELEFNKVHAFYLIVPKGGGLVTRVDDHAVQVITPNSPLGEVLLGKKVGDQITVEVARKPRFYQVIGYS